MAISYSHTEDRGIYYRGEDRVSARALFGSLAEIYDTQDAIRGLSFQFCDFTGTTGTDVEYADVRRMAEIDRHALEVNPDMQIVMLCESDLTFGLARIWESLAYCGSTRPRVFRNRQAAEEALHRYLLA